MQGIIISVLHKKVFDNFPSAHDKSDINMQFFQAILTIDNKENQ